MDAQSPMDGVDAYPAFIGIDGEKFDFVIVGAGSSGATVASRLSENPDWRVLLIEAGGEPPFESIVPGLCPYVLGTQYDWKYQASLDNGTGQSHPRGQALIPAGKVLGGGSSVNFYVYARGVPGDYDNWNKEAPGWSWNDCLPYFKKYEGMTDPETLNKYSNLHSDKGPILVSKPYLSQHFFNINNNIMDSFSEMGIKRMLGLNGPDFYGITVPYSTTYDGRRSSTAEAYLKLGKVRPNLFISYHTTATKILINKRTNQAYGVEAVLKSGETIQVLAEKEVVVSAGAISSPKLLMFSGIGPKDELQKFNIDLIKDLPVGKNYQDHIVVPIVVKGQNGSNSDRSKENTLKDFQSYPFPLTGGYFNVNGSKTQRPEFMFFTIHADANSTTAVQIGCKAYNYDDDACQQVVEANAHDDLEVIALVMLYPASRGQIKLSSRNPLDAPTIELGFFREPQDEILLTEGAKYVARLENTTFFKKVRGGLARLEPTGCADLEFRSDEYWRCYVRSTASSFLHPAGTCAMGAGGKGVVDEYLRVYGIKGLRVADASVMPSVASGNLNAPCMMIGERAADFIKADYSTIDKNDL
ncbi:GMC oxidoreductase domain-containing protein [Phthorimaea operculella]|nr:GMC oxidoreductase domain-containing protein [Phthorimaea operculella]